MDRQALHHAPDQFVLGDPVGNVDPDGLETFFERNDYRGPPVALPSGSLVGAARPPPVAAAASGTSPTRATADVGVRAFVDGIFGKDGRSATVVKNDESTTAPAQLQSAGKNANRTTPPIVGPDPIKPVSTSDAAPTSSASIAPGNVDTSTGSVEASLPGHSLGPSRHAWTLAEVNKQLDVNGDRVITAVEVGNLSSIKGISGEAWAEMMAASPEFSGYAVDPTVHSVIAEVRQEHAVNRSNDLARAEYLNDTNLRAGRDGINLTKREDREAARRDAIPQGSPRRLLALGLVGFTVMFPQAAAVLGAFKTGVDTGQAIGGRHFNGDPLTDDERRGKVVDALVGGVAMGFAGYAAAQAGETIALETSVPSVAPEAELSIAYAPGLPGHNKIGITVDGETQWIELIASEEESEFSANRAIQSSQLTFGDRPAWIQFGSTINPRYQLATMPITRGQAASALAEANAIAANPGRYGILTNSCTTFCRSVMSAAGKQPAWWARSPGLLFKSVP